MFTECCSSGVDGEMGGTKDYVGRCRVCVRIERFTSGGVWVVEYVQLVKLVQCDTNCSQTEIQDTI